MQEDIENRTVALIVESSKITAKGLAKALEEASSIIKQQNDKAQAPHGRQSVKKLMSHGQATSAIPLDGSARLFDRIARKWNVDYSFHKTAPKKYLLLFKSGQADAITACFADYAKTYVSRAKDKRPQARELLENIEARERAKPRERERSREAERDAR